MAKMTENQDFLTFLDDLTKSNGQNDLEELKCENEVLRDQFSKMQTQFNTANSNYNKQLKITTELSKERIQLKKQVIDSNFKSRNSELKISNLNEELTKLKGDLKAKGLMMAKIEDEKRKIETKLLKNGRKSENQENAGIKKGSSDEKLQDLKANLNRDLIAKGQTSAYDASKGSSSSENLEKVTILQRLLLAKVNENAEKEVKIEKLEKTCAEYKQSLDRLKLTKQIAEELTITRHKLNVEQKQVKILKDELNNVKAIVDSQKSEMNTLKDKFKKLLNKE